MSTEIATQSHIPTSSFIDRATRSLAATVRAIMHRRDVHRLLDLDDRCLKDIGLVRSDVVGALDQAWDRDPSTVLMMRSIERRARGRAAAERQASRRPRGYLPA